MAEHPRRANDRRFRERFLDDLLSLEFRPVEGRFRVGGSVEMGEVNVTRHSSRVGDSGNSTGSSNVHGVVVKVPEKHGSKDQLTAEIGEGAETNLVVWSLPTRL